MSAAIFWCIISGAAGFFVGAITISIFAIDPDHSYED